MPVTGKEAFQGFRAVVGDLDCSHKSSAAQGLHYKDFVIGILLDQQQAWGIGIQGCSGGE